MKLDDRWETGIVARKSVPILMLEDEKDYADMFRDYIHDPSEPFSLNVVQSGEEAIAYLSGESVFADRSKYPFPFLILVDLKMPGTGGFGVLRWLVAHPEIKNKLYVVILSGIQSTKEIEVVYELGAALFWAKSDTERLRDELCRLRDSWIRLN